uniref:Replication termination factor 2 n=1 Tax=Equus asinus TaxID=9793 RepID=A0A9L0JBU4_EQUAS|nr:replication termination factor 2 isoform X2 [Equus asinus]
MGCDGGTIPKRHELVKGPKKVEKVDKDAELVAQWNYCTLSQEILRRPIVACELGRLYNKDAVIEFLLDKSSEKALGKAASHIKSIKNVTELRLSDNPAWEGDKGNTKGDKHDDLQRARFICPVVGLEMNGRHRFCFLRCCGCVFSERALREIKAEVCHTEAKENIFYFNNNTCSACALPEPCVADEALTESRASSSAGGSPVCIPAWWCSASVSGLSHSGSGLHHVDRVAWQVLLPFHPWRILFLLILACRLKTACCFCFSEYFFRTESLLTQRNKTTAENTWPR